MTTHNSPYRFGDTQGDLGHSYVFAAQEIAITLEDALNVLGLGVVPLVGDLLHSGSDVVRVTHMGNVGWQAPWDALASETDVPVAKTLITGYSTVSLGQYGVLRQETYKGQQLGREEAISLDALKAREPQAWLATWRQQYATVGSGFSTVIGSSTAALGVDDWLDLVTAYEENLGAMKPVAALAPQQKTQLRASFRNEPAFQNSVDAFKEMQSLAQMQVHRNFAGLGIDIVTTDDIVQSGGAYRGFAHGLGGIGWAVCSTADLKTANPNGTVLIPEFGIAIEELLDGQTQTVRGYRGHALFGMAAGSTDVHVLRSIRSVV
jgi:hypothetical protein